MNFCLIILVKDYYQNLSLLGPELPEPFWYHCMTKYSEDEIIIIGGDGPKTKTIMVDVPNGFIMNEGPPLIHYRLGHACETFQLDGRTMVIVVGGLAGRYSNVTEIWDPMSQFGWQEGKLPPSCNSFLRKDI